MWELIILNYFLSKIMKQNLGFFFEILGYIHINLRPDLSSKLSGIICTKPHKLKILLKYFTS